MADNAAQAGVQNNQGNQNSMAQPQAAPPQQKPRPTGQGIEIDIFGPLAFWLVLLVMGVLLELVMAPLLSSTGNAGLASTITAIASYILYLPGSIILPLIVAVWLGERVGATKSEVGSAVPIAAINAAYTALIYAVAIFIIYLLLRYITPAFLSTVSLTTFVLYVVVVPVVIVVVLIPFIASLSAARHKNL